MPLELLDPPVAAEEPRPRPRRASIFDNAVMIRINIGAIGSRRQIQPGLIGGQDDDTPVKVASDPNWIAATKRLFDCEEFQAIKRMDSAIRRFVREKCLPAGEEIGFHLVPTPLVPEVNAELEKFRVQRAELVKRFIAVYEQVVERSRETLGNLFNEADYLTPDRAAAKYSLDWSFVEMGTPGRLRQVSPKLFEEEQRKALLRLQQATQIADQVITREMNDLVEHLLTRLTKTDESGNLKQFRSNNIERVKSFLEALRYRNISENQDIEKLAAQMEGLIEGADLQSIRDDGAVRERFEGGFKVIKEQLSLMLEDAPTRAFTLEEAE